MRTKLVYNALYKAHKEKNWKPVEDILTIMKYEVQYNNQKMREYRERKKNEKK